MNVITWLGRMTKGIIRKLSPAASESQSADPDLLDAQKRVERLDTEVDLKIRKRGWRPSEEGEHRA